MTQPAINSAYDWNAAMAGTGLSGASIFGSNFNPAQMVTAALPTGVGASAPILSSADFSWGAGTAAQPFSYGMGGQTPMGVTPGMPVGGGGGLGGWFSNGQNLGAVVNGIGALTSAWLGYKNLSLAKDQLSFQKDAFNKNYGNQVKSYNTSLEDRIRGRTADYAGKEADVAAYLDKHKLGG